MKARQSLCAQALRRRGIDVSTPEEAGLAEASDVDHLEYALKQSRVIFTQDADFLALHQAGHRHAGLVYCQQQTRTIGQIVKSLVLLWELCEPDKMNNHVEFI